MPNAVITLTEEQRIQVHNDMTLQEEMFTDAEVEHLATLLNNKIEIPFLPAGKEKSILFKIVRKVDRYLYEILPNELYTMAKSTKEGLSVDDADELHSIIVMRATSNFTIRYLPESVEQQIFNFLVSLVLRAMRKNMNIMKL